MTYIAPASTTERCGKSRCETRKKIEDYWEKVEDARGEYPTPIQSSIHKMFVTASPRWRNRAEALDYIKNMGGDIVFGVVAAKALAVGIKGYVVFFISNENPYSHMMPMPAFEFQDWPAAVVLPEENVLKILALGLP